MNKYKEVEIELKHNWYRIPLILFTLFIIITINAYGDDYINYYLFEDDLTSESGTDTGVMYGGGAYVSGYKDKSLSLDGNGDYVLIEDSDNYDFSEYMSMNMWIKSYSNIARNEEIINKDYNGVRSFYVRKRDSDLGITVRLQDADYIHCNIALADINDGNYNMFSFVFNNTHLVCYWNGEEVENKENAGSDIAISNQNITIGTIYGVGANDFNGSIDELRFYNRSLTYLEVKNLYLYDDQHNTTCNGEITYTDWIDIGCTMYNTMNQSRIERNWISCVEYTNETEYNYTSCNYRQINNIEEGLDMIWYIVLLIGLLIGGAFITINYNPQLGIPMQLGSGVLLINLAVRQRADYGQLWANLIVIIAIAIMISSTMMKSKRNKEY